MTKEEAINILETNAINATGTLGSLPPTAAEKSGLKRQIEALDMAIAALEKQIAKKPRKYIAFDGIKRNGCPTCPKDEILYAGQKYCSVCGQKIDWSEEE